MEENIKEENVNVVNSEELNELMGFIYESLSDELPTLTIDLNYFL